MAALKPTTDRAQVLHAALLLHTFTAQDLADCSGVKIGTVRTVLDRDASFFIETELQLSGKPGGQYKRYELAEGVREQLKTVLMGLPAEERPEFGYVPKSESDEDQESRAVLAAATNALEQAERIRGDSQNHWLLRAEQQLNAARLSLQLCSATPGHKERQLWLSKIQTRLETLKSASNHEREPLPPALMELLQRSADMAHRWLLDWSFQLDDITTSPAEARALFDAQVVPLLEGAKPEMCEQDILFPAAAYVAARPHLRTREIIDCRTVLVRRLSHADAPRLPNFYAALIACAAVMGAEGALNPILGAIATREFEPHIAGPTRRTTLQAIARFARPAPGASSQMGTLACYLLLSRSSQRERDMQWLLPGALLAKNVDAFSMLEEFARIYYGDDENAKSLAAAEERALARNLAIVINAFTFDNAAPYARRLLAHAPGTRLLQALQSRWHDAVHMREDDNEGFVVGPGYALLQSGDVTALFEQPLGIDPDSEEGQRLNHMLLRDSSTLSPVEFAPERLSRAGADSQLFSEALRHVPWHERRKLPRPQQLDRPT